MHEHDTHALPSVCLAATSCVATYCKALVFTQLAPKTPQCQPSSHRAKFIVGSVAALRDKPGGGVAWLHGLRSVPYQEAVEALSALPGVGPKVSHGRSYDEQSL